MVFNRRHRTPIVIRPTTVSQPSKPPDDRDKDRTLDSQTRRLSLVQRRLEELQAMLGDILKLARNDEIAPLNDRDDAAGVGA